MQHFFKLQLPEEQCVVSTYNNGDEWSHFANPEPYLFITFKPNNPFRQILADFTWDERPGGVQPGSPFMPRAIICKAAMEQEGRDETSDSVKDYLSKRYTLGTVVTKKDTEIFGWTVLHLTKDTW